MKHVTKMVLITAIIMNMAAMASQGIVIRPAEIKDLEAIQNLCHHEHHNGSFKSGLAHALGEWMMIGSVTDDWVDKQVNKFITMQTNKNSACVQEQKSNNNRLLVAYVKKSVDSEKLAAYCL